LELRKNQKTENTEKTKQYTNGEITIEWKPSKCIHAAKCIKALPNVYKPTKKPWIIIENATSEALKSQINECPSGGLSYFYNKNKESE